MHLSNLNRDRREGKQAMTNTEDSSHTPDVQPSDTTARKRGFATMTREQVSAIASKGGKAAHAVGSAHKFTPEEASAAGKKGGAAPHRIRGRGKKVAE